MRPPKKAAGSNCVVSIIFSFALQLLSTIYASTERESKANDADKASLELNPFLFKSFEALCNRGPDHPSPYKVFNAETLSNLNYSVGINPVSSHIYESYMQIRLKMSVPEKLKLSTITYL